MTGDRPLFHVGLVRAIAPCPAQTAIIMKKKLHLLDLSSSSLIILSEK
jgi:hypothetical protein